MDQPAVPYRSSDLDDRLDTSPVAETETASVSSRRAPRIKTLIRSAKLITKQGEFVCVVRDVSRTGVRVRLFHALPDEPQMALQMPSGSTYELRPVRQMENEAGFEFISEVDVETLVHEASDYPKRALRFSIFFPITVNAPDGRWEAVVENLSQQGARFECEGLFAIDQTLKLVGEEGAEGFSEIEAKVRWRRDNAYGVVFDNTFSLNDFATLCMRLQSPMLAID